MDQRPHKFKLKLHNSQKKIRENLHDIGFGNFFFFDRTPKTQAKMTKKKKKEEEEVEELGLHQNLKPQCIKEHYRVKR